MIDCTHAQLPNQQFETPDGVRVCQECFEQDRVEGEEDAMIMNEVMSVLSRQDPFIV
jgi:hypothetical protein